jgi:hypothetical protein
LASNPRDVIAAFNSFGSIDYPLNIIKNYYPSVSNKSKASLISSTSSSVRPGLTYSAALNLFV